jgi:hypothetical protein
MARTFRNRNSVPHDAVVRDGGRVFYTCCPNKKAQKASWDAVCCPYTDELCRCHARDSEDFRRGYHRCERKAERKEHNRSYRAQVRDRMAHENWENLPRFRRTSGWLTW